MSSSTSLRVSGYLTGAAGVVLLAWTVALRVTSPWPLEWMEGASLQHAIRITRGLPLYGPPTAEFIPYLYPPLAYLPMAIGVWLLGPSLWVGRLVSVLALGGSLACIFVTVRRSGSSAAIGCWAVGVYALGFGYDGAFADLVRVDSVFMLLVLLGIERLSARSYATGLIWLVLSCFAKQHGVFFLSAAAGGLLLTEGRRVGQQLMAAAGAALAGTAALQANSSGYYLKYTASVATGHGLEPALLLSYLGVDVALYLPVLTALTLAWLWRAWRSRESRGADDVSADEAADPSNPSAAGPDVNRSPASLSTPLGPEPSPNASDTQRGDGFGGKTAAVVASRFSAAGESPRPSSAAPLAVSRASGSSAGVEAPHVAAPRSLEPADPAARASAGAEPAQPTGPASLAAPAPASRFSGLAEPLHVSATASRAPPDSASPASGAGESPDASVRARTRPPISAPRASGAGESPDTSARALARLPVSASRFSGRAEAPQASGGKSPARPAPAPDAEPSTLEFSNALPPNAPGLSAPLLSLLLAAGLAASALGRAHPGGFDNVRMPGFAVLVIAAAISLPATWAAAGRALRSLLITSLILQPLMLLQLPAAHAPTPAQAAQFQALEDALRRCGDGDLSHSVALDHSLLTARPFLHTMALSDLRQSAEAQPLAAAGTQALIDALRARDAPASIAVSATFPDLERALHDHYDVCQHLPQMHFATGYQLRPTIIYRRKT